MIDVQNVSIVGGIHTGANDGDYEFEVLYNNGDFDKFISDQHLLLTGVYNRIHELIREHPTPNIRVDLPDDVRVERYGDKG